MLGFEIAPHLHIGFHGLFAHHHHGDEHSDDHGDEHDEDSPEHGQGSIEHHGVAVLAAPPPPIIPPAVVVEVQARNETATELPRDRRPRTVRGRDPPVVALS